MSADPSPAAGVREPFPNVPAAGSVGTDSVPRSLHDVPHSAAGEERKRSTDRGSVINAVISHLGLTAFTRTSNNGKRKASPPHSTDCARVRNPLPLFAEP